MAAKPEPDRLLVLEKLLRRQGRELRDLTARLEWFLDPPPARPGDEAAPAVAPAPVPKPEHVPLERLKKGRPRHWEEGRKAFEDGAAKSANPYRDTRGGFRNAWFGGWEERREEGDA